MVKQTVHQYHGIFSAMKREQTIDNATIGIHGIMLSVKKPVPNGHIL